MATATGSNDERSLVLIKPDGVVRRQAGVEVMKAVCGLPGCRLLCFREVTPVPTSLASLHYLEHEGKPFYPWLVNLITSKCGVVMLVLEGPGMIKKVRDLLGPTMVDKAAAAAPESMRGKHGLIAGINIAHASDSPCSGLRETGLWMSALMLVPEEAKASESFKAYVRKYDGEKTEAKSVEIQDLANKLQAAYHALKACVLTETDLGESFVNELMAHITLTLK